MASVRSSSASNSARGVDRLLFLTVNQNTPVTKHCYCDWEYKDKFLVLPHIKEIVSFCQNFFEVVVDAGSSLFKSHLIDFAPITAIDILAKVGCTPIHIKWSKVFILYYKYS